MAKKHSEGGKESKAEKKKLHAILTTRADDGGFVHEHHYRDDKGNPEPPRYGGVSTSMDDLHAHMDDHLGPGAESAESPQDEAAEPQQEAPAAEAAEPPQPQEPQQ